MKLQMRPQLMGRTLAALCEKIMVMTATGYWGQSTSGMLAIPSHREPWGPTVNTIDLTSHLSGLGVAPGENHISQDEY